MYPSFEILKLGTDGSEQWMGDVESHDLALFDIELTAAKWPGKYAILNQGRPTNPVIPCGLQFLQISPTGEVIDRRSEFRPRDRIREFDHIGHNGPLSARL